MIKELQWVLITGVVGEKDELNLTVGAIQTKEINYTVNNNFELDGYVGTVV
jgi:hypothetical protein